MTAKKKVLPEELKKITEELADYFESRDYTNKQVSGGVALFLINIHADLYAQSGYSEEQIVESLTTFNEIYNRNVLELIKAIKEDSDDGNHR